MSSIRNIAIIAHVDHGKTTLVDALLRQSQTNLHKDLEQTTCILDMNELERERGITIFSKNASVRWHGTKINIIDTPGHADFGGEVERVLSMADGCLLLVDAQEGPMPQTRFVLKKALQHGLKILVVINKIDKPHADPQAALNKTFDLFIELGADETQADFPVVYASAREGKAGHTPDLSSMQNIEPLFDAILSHIPSPSGDPGATLQMHVTSVSGDSFKGRIGIGRIVQGTMRIGEQVAHIARDGGIKKCRLSALMSFEGLERAEILEAQAGDIVAVAGIPDVMIGETIADPTDPRALPLLAIEEPTVKLTLLVNDSPFAGREGQYTTSRQIRERLFKELETDMALRVEDTLQGTWILYGRGELHLAIFLERLRREGYEFQVSRPHVVTKTVDGETFFPFEQVFVEVPEEHAGAVIQSLGSRHGELREMRTENDITFLEFHIPTRGLFGYRSVFLTETRGLGILHSSFLDYHKDQDTWKEREQGSLIAHETGTSATYGLLNVQNRGIFFIGPGREVYKGQVVGQHSRAGDLSVNVCKTKQLSNMRSKGEGVSEKLNTPRTMELEDALEYIGDDEFVEVTPQSIRIRKIILDELQARRQLLGIKNQRSY